MGVFIVDVGSTHNDSCCKSLIHEAGCAVILSSRTEAGCAYSIVGSLLSYVKT